MKKSDFKKFLYVYAEFCRELIDNDGYCDTKCGVCPFHTSNAVNNKDCIGNKYVTEFESESAINSATEYLNLYSSEKYAHLITLTELYNDHQLCMDTNGSIILCKKFVPIKRFLGESL